MSENKDAEMKKQEREQIVELGSDITKSSKGNIYTLTIIGQVEGHMIAPETVKTTKYEHVLPLLAGIEESDDVDGLLLLLNTVGGDIEAGLAIAEMIAGMKKPTVSLVLGGGHSIGIPLAVCTKKSFITPTASMTVHPVRMTGLVVGAPQTFRYFQRIQEQIADFVTSNSRISREDFEHYMMATGEIATDVGTILYGKEAVASGLIDKLGGMDIYLHCSGIGKRNTELHPDIEIDTLRTNGEGFVRMVTAAFGYFRAHGGGHLAVISSIAGTKGLGSAPAYSATKRMQNTYIDALAQLAHMEKLNIRFTDIRPGFVATPLLAGDGHYPMLMQVGKVAARIMKVLKRQRRRVVIDRRYAVMVFFWKMIPEWLWERLNIRKND